jgi:hypothetical protein
MMAAALEPGQRYEPNKISRAWLQTTVVGEKIADLTAALRSSKAAPLSREGNVLATHANGPSRCQAFPAWSAHWMAVMVWSPRSGQRLKASLPG